MWSVVWKFSTPHSTFSTTFKTAHNNYTITNQQFIIFIIFRHTICTIIGEIIPD